MNYYITPNSYIAQNHCVASSAVGKGIASAYYPKLIADGGDMRWRFIVPQTMKPDNTVLVLFRDPVDRFLSAIAQNKISIEEGIYGLSDQLSRDPHFTLQSQFLKTGQPNRIYKFPDQLDKFCADAGLSPLEKINPHPNKLIPTDEQIAIIRKHYAEDVSIFEAL